MAELKQMVPPGAGVLDTVVSIKIISGVYRIETNNSGVFLLYGLVKVFNKKFLERGKFIIRMISPQQAGSYIWTEQLPEGTEEGDFLVLAS